MQNFAPIALFVYNRPQHTERTLKFLKQNELAAESRLFIFSDGAKTADDEEKVNAVTAKEVQDVAKKYLTKDRAIGTLMPEKS